MNKRQFNIYERYLSSKATYLWQVYGRYSMKKQKAYEKCVEKYNELKGRRFRIISFNSNVFTIGFEYDNNGNTYFHYETAVKTEEWLVTGRI